VPLASPLRVAGLALSMAVSALAATPVLAQNDPPPPPSSLVCPALEEDGIHVAFNDGIESTIAGRLVAKPSAAEAVSR
jgi:hypothetical protein